MRRRVLIALLLWAVLAAYYTSASGAAPENQRELLARTFVFVLLLNLVAWTPAVRARTRAIVIAACVLLLAVRGTWAGTYHDAIADQWAYAAYFAAQLLLGLAATAAVLGTVWALDRLVQRSFPTMRSLALGFLLCASVPALVFAADERKTPSPRVTTLPRFVVVLKTFGADEPDLAKFGGMKENRWQNRLLVRLPDDSAAALSAHPSVLYVQRILTVGERAPVMPASHAVPGPVPGNVQSDAVTNPSWSSGTYRYDGSGNIINIGADYYAYDNLNRVARASLTGTGAYETYSYDSFANLVDRGSSLGGGWSNQSIPVNGWDNKINGATYDSSGNFVSGGGLPYTYGYDPFDMTIQQTGNNRQDYYVYDANDERIGSMNNPQSTWRWTVRDLNGNVVREFESGSWNGASWMWVEDFAFRGHAVAGAERTAADGGRRHFHLDHLGTTRMVTNHSGQAISRHDYAPFGLEVTSIRQEGARGYDHENPRRFAGHERDFTAGTLSENTDYVDYMHARYYRPAWGRFMTVDPTMSSAKMRLPQTWNRYSYAKNSPINHNDLDGRETNPVSGKNFIFDNQILNSPTNPKKGHFGMVRSGGKQKHGGNDLKAPKGTPIVAPISGKVIQSNTTEDPKGGYVLRIKKVEDGHTVYVHMSHLNAPANVKVNEMVTEGQANVGEVGNTGNAKGEPPHVHLSVYVDGQTEAHKVDPMQWFKDHPKKPEDAKDQAAEEEAKKRQQVQDGCGGKNGGRRCPGVTPR